MAIDDLFVERLTNAGSAIFVFAVQALEDDEDLVEIAGIDANPVVTDAEPPFLPDLFASDIDRRRSV